MRRTAVLTGVIALWVFVALVHVDPAAARTPNLEDAAGPNGGVPGGRWYSYGMVTQTRWIDTYETTWNPWPLPGHYEVRILRRLQTIFFLKEVCSHDPQISECTPGSERLTIQFIWG
jgi:hypothetical protein